MNMLEQAIALATMAHAGHVDRAGAPYILHPLRVMLAMHTAEERIVAVLHDVVEDSGITLACLEQMGFSESVLSALAALTKRADEEHDYAGFIRRAACHDLARPVKIADLRDNLDLSRIATPTAADRIRRLRCERALAYIATHYPDYC